MIDILNTFLSGITFALGIALGATLCQIATRKGRTGLSQEAKEINNKIHDRLNSSLLCHERMAISLETIANQNRKQQ